jgi:hypothetical protein
MYRYVVAHSNGQSWIICRDQAEFDATRPRPGMPTEAQYVLPGLLAEGWRPVREVPMGRGSVLILLEGPERGAAEF